MPTRPKSMLLENIEEVLRRKISAKEPNTSNMFTLEQWLERAAKYIDELEQSAAGALSADYLKKFNYLERLIEDNKDMYIRKEKKYLEIMADLRRRVEETYERLPVEERLKTDFICFTCELTWDREFLRMTDKQGNQFCWDCVETGVKKAGDDIGQIILIEATPKSRSIKSFICEFCGVQELGKSNKWHIINAPDGRDSRKIIKLCKNCQLTRAKMDNNINYCPRRTSARDDEDKPEYDCDCVPKDKY